MITENDLYDIGFKRKRVSKFDTKNFDDYVYSKNGFLIAKYNEKWHHTYYGRDYMGRYGFGEYSKSEFREFKTVSDICKLYSMFEIKTMNIIILPKVNLRYELRKVTNRQA
jgi:hypothetical protein